MSFSYSDLKLIEPPFSSELTDLVMELEHLRKLEISGSTPPYIFFQLKEVFHLLESFNSARIEGNRTTLAELAEVSIAPPQQFTDALQEIENMNKAMTLIETYQEEGMGINKALMRELHKVTVQRLTREGDPTPGEFRNQNVKITGSRHTPPDYVQINGYIDELVEFFNEHTPAKYDLIKIALAHHRFAWIHPFRNGNGRVVRLLTHAMLIDRGFKLKQHRILNPSAVFCSNRNRYFEMLSAADEGETRSLIAWCEYVLRGLRDELIKIDKLLDYGLLSKRILQPAVDLSRDRAMISPLEHRVLTMAVQKVVFQSKDLILFMPGKGDVARSRMIGKLKQARLIRPLSENGRKYHIRFSPSPLLRGVMSCLQKEGFIGGN